MSHDSSHNRTSGNDAADNDTGQSLGVYLQRERLKKQYTLEQIAEETCIHIATLRAIESNDRNKMPAEVFARGFIKLYAEYLGLDQQEVLDRYTREMGHREEVIVDQQTMPNVTLSRGTPFFSMRLVGYILLLLAIAGGAYYFFFRSGSTFSENSLSILHSDLTTKSSTVSSPVETGGSGSIAASSAAPQGMTASAPGALPGRLDLHVLFKEKTWMQVEVDDQPPQEYLYDPDEEGSWQGRKKIKLHVGNSGGIQIFLNDEQLPVTGTYGSPLILTLPDDIYRNLN